MNFEMYPYSDELIDSVTKLLGQFYNSSKPDVESCVYAIKIITAINETRQKILQEKVDKRAV